MTSLSLPQLSECRWPRLIRAGVSGLLGLGLAAGILCGQDAEFLRSRSELLPAGQTVWRDNLIQGRSLGLLAPGGYLLSFEAQLENGLPGEKLTAFVSGQEKRLNEADLTNLPFPQVIRLPFTLSEDSEVQVSIGGIPKMSAAGRLQVSGLTITPWKNAGELLPVAGFRLQPDGRTLDGWQVQFNQRPADLAAAPSPGGEIPAAADAAALELRPRNGGMLVSLYSPELLLPKDTQLTGSVWIRGEAEISLFAVSAKWKKVPGWKDKTHLRGSLTKTSADWHHYEFSFPSPGDDLTFAFRIDVKGANPVQLAAPSVVARSADEAAAAAVERLKAGGGGRTAREVLSLDFEQDLGAPSEVRAITRVTGVRGQGAALPADGRLVYPLPLLPGSPTAEGESGALSVWVKLDRDFEFDRAYRGFWELGDPALSGRLAHARFYFGDKYFDVMQRIFSGDWHHLVFTWDPRQGRKIYLDGLIAWHQGGAFAGHPGKTLGFGAKGALPGIGGAIDEVKLFDAALGDDEVRALYAKTRQVTPFMIDFAVLEGSGNRFRVGLDNTSNTEVARDYTVQFSDSAGRPLAESRLTAAIPAGQKQVRELDFDPPAAGDYRLTLRDETGDGFTFKLTVPSSRRITDAMPAGEVRKRLLEEIDCTAAPDPARYRDDTRSRVTTSAAGTYRETTGHVLNSGFAYRFKIEHPGRPHWLEIDYPDDCDRTFYYTVGGIVGSRLWSGFLDTGGVITGGAHPVTNTLQTKRLLFYPDDPEFLVLFGSHLNPNGEAGPAVARIRIYENEGDLPKSAAASDGRKIMIWNEDPTMPAYSWFKQYRWNGTDFGFWRDRLDRLVRYTRYIGWQEWNMVAFDYLGDSTAGDRRLVSSSYAGADGFLPGHLDLLAVTAERERIPFYLSLNHLTEWSNHTYAGLARQLGTGRLSPDFFTAAARGVDAPELFTADNELARKRLLALNPIHPAVRATYKTMVRAYVEKYRRYAAFAGIDYQASETLHFNSPRNGYGDYEADLFRRETGVSLPEFTGIRRFSQRYDWLRENAWSAWIDWRCRQVRDLAAELVGELEGRKLIFRVRSYQPEALKSALERGESPDMKGLLREMGVDVDLLAQVPGLVVMPDLRPNFTRVTGAKADEQAWNFSDELAAVWRNLAAPAAQVTQHANLEIYTSLGAELPIKNLWGASSMVSFSTPHPNNAFALESFVWLLANVDPVLINHGWWGNPEAGVYDEFRRFYRAFAALPERRFETAPGVNDPVTVRYSGDSLYLVNQAAFPVRVSLSLPGVRRLTDVLETADGGDPVPGRDLVIAGQELRVFKADAAIHRVAVTQVAPEAEKRALAKQLDRLRTLAATPETKAILVRAQALFDAGRPVAAGHALGHRLVRELLGQKPWRSSTELQLAPARLRLKLSQSETPAGTVRLSTPAESLRGVVRLVKWPEGWTPANLAGRPVSLERGAERTLDFEFAPPSAAEPGQVFRFTLSVEIDGQSTLLEEQFQPFVATPVAGRPPAVDGNLGDWADARWTTLDSRLPGQRLAGDALIAAEEFSAAFACRWSEAGLWLAVKVEDRDFFAPKDPQKLWLDDSLVVYFDPLDDARRGLRGYQADDRVFRIGLGNGAPLVLGGTGSTPEPVSAVTAAIARGDETTYELFIPRSELPLSAWRAGVGCGFSLEIINWLKSGKRVVLCPHPEPPHQTPYVWSDLILTEP